MEAWECGFAGLLCRVSVWECEAPAQKYPSRRRKMAVSLQYALRDLFVVPAAAGSSAHQIAAVDLDPSCNTASRVQNIAVADPAAAFAANAAAAAAVVAPPFPAHSVVPAHSAAHPAVAVVAAADADADAVVAAAPIPAPYAVHARAAAHAAVAAVAAADRYADSDADADDNVAAAAATASTAVVAAVVADAHSAVKFPAKAAVAADDPSACAAVLATSSALHFCN